MKNKKIPCSRNPKWALFLQSKIRRKKMETGPHIPYLCLHNNYKADMIGMRSEHRSKFMNAVIDDIAELIKLISNNMPAELSQESLINSQKLPNTTLVIQPTSSPGFLRPDPTVTVYKERKA